MSKWTYEEFYKAITDLQGRVKQLESKQLDTELNTLQHRRALCDAVSALERGLTESPVAWSKENERVWREVNSVARARQNNVLNDVKSLPY